jgi:hypothetical protein
MPAILRQVTSPVGVSMRGDDQNVDFSTFIASISGAEFAIRQTPEPPFYSQPLNNVRLQIGRFHGRTKLWKKYEEPRKCRDSSMLVLLQTLQSMGKPWKGAQHGN